MDVRFDVTGVKVRNFWRTYRLRWDEVSYFGDGGADWWALNVARRNGRALVATGTTSGAESLAKAGVLAAIRQVGERYHVPVELTGRPAGSVAGRIRAGSGPAGVDDAGQYERGGGPAQIARPVLGEDPGDLIT